MVTIPFSSYGGRNKLRPSQTAVSGEIRLRQRRQVARGRSPSPLGLQKDERALPNGGKVNPPSHTRQHTTELHGRDKRAPPEAMLTLTLGHKALLGYNNRLFFDNQNQICQNKRLFCDNQN